ncbi:hypothetical protein A3K34_04090 [candidate division WWE3 bacterium RIFOXYC1_FULL_40_10]|uniref:Uncharacterized protein n=1 Tax=candidate division WWE3 bacterium RIFOXYA2_FULL_46_9 TaxID=1802636 RepID=A0A1F4W0Z2_UNCKA|nr:MAG: hypothetical protein A3K58_04090 [candidate division WWE3 bacterium RIFOXYB1_FULL_40_22]OGC62021.1 MAG: hypothetical protein A3K37_04090 [candidate division WWE3 bacterium RIFOXYA1_FULL_40_11]OGC62938.1 MAG: hypothetical protein A2264_03605 [candidate division WWE3 bacterium RIFOXYA2_FULL_46_9]OGC65035.1 MAG: hypothetical protein A2326_03280 [candidate division WWE3 bacterium RIFOXYB2_FULL_41_6]OGC66404.1 MAG: hypothetical protein A3K34_04090 [candidate division WWE3 bacterium RIFOXYC1_
MLIFQLVAPIAAVMLVLIIGGYYDRAVKEACYLKPQASGEDQHDDSELDHRIKLYRCLQKATLYSLIEVTLLGALFITLLFPAPK